MTVLELVQQFMLDANTKHLENRTLQSVGFVVYPDNGKTACNFLYAPRAIRTLDALRRFGVALRSFNKSLGGTHAGVVCSVPISSDGRPPVESVVIYVDQKLGGLHVWTATKVADSPLLFRDHGHAFPGTSVFPELFTAESYEPSGIEA